MSNTFDEIDVAAQVLAAHDYVGTTVSLAQDDGNLGHSSLGISVKKLGTMSYNASMLLVLSW